MIDTPTGGAEHRLDRLASIEQSEIPTARPRQTCPNAAVLLIAVSLLVTLLLACAGLLIAKA